jgi:hypothetical protein
MKMGFASTHSGEPLLRWISFHANCPGELDADNLRRTILGMARGGGRLPEPNLRFGTNSLAPLTVV